jgi:SAM-dependent methyltransferase
MLAVMSDEVTFSPDLYRGTAEFYDRFRLSYPDPLISDLVHRTRPSGRGRLLDLACGTGQLAFALRSSFAEVRAVDQEPADALAAQAAAFDDSLSAELGPYVRDGHLTETVSFAYELAREAPAA